MKKLFLLIAACVLMVPVKSNAIPSQITYQGTLKEHGVPVTDTKKMTFLLVSSDGQTPYSQIITKQVSVQGGLFSTQLDFQLAAPYTWETVTPFIQVSVEDVTLGPPEAVTATVYANVASSVIDGSITPAKINTTAFQAAGPGLVPAGAVIMFATSCPQGWTRFSALDNLFPMGASTYGNQGGSATHSHSLQNNGAISQVSYGAIGNVGVVGGGDGGLTFTVGNNNQTAYQPKSSNTTSASNVPPYLTVIFCQKN
jgi:hypothetical protein